MPAQLGDRTTPGVMPVQAVKKTADNAAREPVRAILRRLQPLWKPVMQELVVPWENNSQQDTVVTARRLKQRLPMNPGDHLLEIEGRSPPEVPFGRMVP